VLGFCHIGPLTTARISGYGKHDRWSVGPPGDEHSRRCQRGQGLGPTTLPSASTPFCPPMYNLFVGCSTTTAWLKAGLRWSPRG
jgi:hypothetical protein